MRRVQDVFRECMLMRQLIAKDPCYANILEPRMRQLDAELRACKPVRTGDLRILLRLSELIDRVPGHIALQN